MPLSPESKKLLNVALEALSKEGYTIWGAMLPRDDGTLETFTNTGESIEVLAHNFEEVSNVLRESYNITKHEA